MNSHTKTLRQLHAYSHILITAHKDNITDCTIARKLYQISYDERIDAFLLSGGIEKTQSHFYVVTVGKPTVFRGRASFSGGAVIPINSQQCRVLRNSLREGFQFLHG